MPKRKRKQPARPAGREPMNDSENDGEVDEEELEFLREEGLLEGRFDFLTKLAPKKLVGVKREKKRGPLPPAPDGSDDIANNRKRRHHDSDRGSEDEAAEFESRPRPSQWAVEEAGEDLHYLLPLKSRLGLVQQPAIQRPGVEKTSEVEPPEEGTSERRGDQEEGEDIPQVEAPPVLTAAQLFARRHQKLTEKKECIAEMASLLVENPEENIIQLRKLRSLCSEQDPDVAITVRKFAMVSLMAVFKDITPSYRIRELTENEKTVKVSKDVRKLRQFEQTLLVNYQQFLSLLDDTIKVGLAEAETVGRRKRRKERKKSLIVLENGQLLSQASLEGLVEVSLQCLCELVVSLAHFNFHNNILTVLIPRMNSKALGGKVSQMCCKAIEKLFKSDIVGEVSLEAVQLIAKMVKAKSYKTKPVVLRAFLHLQLQYVDEPVGVTGSAGGRGGKNKMERKREARAREAKMTRKQKKRMKMEVKLDRELKETQAEESKEKKNKVQTETIKLVFLTYFRILKHSRHSPLLQPVLEGLAKFSHLINVDFFSDLMSVLHSLAETGGLSNRECMQCVLTAFAILSGQGAALNIDPRQFYTQLYGAILQLDACSSREDVLLAVECLDRLLRKRRQVSLQRVLGFVKRLSTISLHLAKGACLAVMATIKQFMHAYSQCEQLLDVESVSGGVFRPDVSDPEMSQASCTLLWELTMLRRHYDPSVRSYAHHLLAGAPSQGRGSLHHDLARKTPKNLLSESSLCHSTPMLDVPSPPTHPAVKLAQKKKRKEYSEYYYTDSGVISEVIRHSELLATQLANQVLET